MVRLVLNYKSSDYWWVFVIIVDYSYECLLLFVLFEIIFINCIICLFVIYDYLFSGFLDIIYINVM